MSDKKQVIRYNYNYLQQYCKENNIELLKDYTNENINIYTIIEGICVTCNNNFSKGMKPLCINGGVCKKCGIKIRMEKIKCKNKELYGFEYALQSSTIKNKLKAHNLETYGVENQFQLEETKHKIKQTNLRKYGFEHPLKNKNIINKIKATCLEKYGFEHPLQNKNIINKIKATSLEKYGVEHPSQNAEIRQKTIKTCLIKYGVEYSLQSPDVRDKIKQSCFIKLGVENPLQSPEVKEKIKQSCLIKYGVENPFQSHDVKEKIKQTNLVKYGVENPFQSHDVKEKIKQTNLVKYGVENPQQNSEVSSKMSKNAYKSKDYIFPSGRIERIQGYEHFMLNELLQKDDILEDDIIVSRKEVPAVWYEDVNGKKRRYFVDCFIKSQNKCIEVKSTWTAEKKNDCIFLKQQALKDAGYECEIWVYNGKGEKVECYK